ncbi:hypothetical protein [Actinacidiphila sp. ITFR-21]|uniref:hypothetical protein n=1 Tax=Actinacidiphila sp. ITFR-21 TaxID=3075199 RepID=UPI00288B995E|nr:hypothetical protein [Streptomyces sp. ITFR-21]WNI15538.1 hypothetical protein RLT57_08380 [Streptomyces sp. ITFR-21]
MHTDRYRLHDGPLLRRLMECPPPGGQIHTVRSLAAATGLSYSKIQKLITEDRPTATLAEADRIARELRVRRKALFSPSSSPSQDGDTREETPDGPR